MTAVLRCVLRRVFRLIPAADERALRRLSAVYTAIGSPPPDLRGRVLARHAALTKEGTTRT